MLPGELGLAVHNVNGPLVAGRGAQAAAVAAVPVYFNDLSYHKKILLAFGMA